MQFATRWKKNLPIKRIYDMMNLGMPYELFRQRVQYLIARGRENDYLYFFEDGNVDRYEFLARGWKCKEIIDPMAGRT